MEVNRLPLTPKKYNPELTHLGLFLLFGPHTSAITPPFFTLCTLLHFAIPFF